MFFNSYNEYKLKDLDFILVGFSRCGTTTLFQLLKQHPQVYIPKQKECLHRIGETKLNYLKRFFPKEYSGKKIGTITPQLYRYYEDIHDWFPNSKIIIGIRDIEKRRKSLIKLNSNRHRDFAFPLEVMLDHQYWIEQWDKWYGNVFIYNLDELYSEPQKLLDKLCKYLEIDNFTPKRLHKIYAKRSNKCKWAQRLLKLLPIKYLFTKNFRQKIWWFLESLGRNKAQ